MKIDIIKVPFSMRGSYLAISWLPKNFGGQTNQEGLFLRTIHGLTYLPNSTMLNSPAFCAQIIPVWNEEEVEYTVCAEEDEIRILTGKGEIHICFADPDTLLINGEGKGIGLHLRLIDGNYAYEVQGNTQKNVLMNCGRNSRRFLVRKNIGEIDLVAEKDGEYAGTVSLCPDTEGKFLFGIEDIQEEWDQNDRNYCYEESRRESHSEFEGFLRTVPDVPEKYGDARRLAAYINWSGIVKKSGILTREAMLMAKNWMCNVWSWDHCFNAMALAYRNPSMAWDQFMLLFDYQGKTGRIPDCVNDVYAIWNFCKPPIHGWALSRMRRWMDLTQQQYEEVYSRLEKWTNWWLTYRDGDRDGICEYHHGNDAGWDNSTVFRANPVMELPDLATFLILQMDELKSIAEKLGKKEEALEWSQKADRMFNAMIKHCFDGVRPRALVSHSHEEVKSDSLILFIPVLLGKKLPEEIRSYLVKELKSKRFLTEHGLATEALESPFYVADGYWRGPIWAPSSLLLIDGLRTCGEREYSRELARRFCDMAVKSGFAENFDAVTGEGLRDKAYTWTSSVFLILAHEYI